MSKYTTPDFSSVALIQPDGSNVDQCRREQVEQGAQLVLAGAPGCEIASGLLMMSKTL